MSAVLRQNTLEAEQEGDMEIVDLLMDGAAQWPKDVSGETR